MNQDENFQQKQYNAVFLSLSYIISKQFIQNLFVHYFKLKMIRRQLEPGAVFYRIRVDPKNVSFQEADHNDLYSPGDGFVRKAIFQRVQRGNMTGRFTDTEFQCSPPANTRMVRLYDFYKKQIDLFPYDESQSSYITPQQTYNSFMAESGVIRYSYLRTLFITQTVNQRGYYQYFVKRDGEYYVEECDDLIPVDKATWKPLWGLSTTHPWQLMLFKAWLKECGSIQNMYKAQPFRLLQAFGLPEYRVFNFRKQLKFILNERGNESQKHEKKSSFTLNNQEANIIGQTVNSRVVRDVGLVPNAAGYRITRVNSDSKTPLYQVFSSLPCHWVGSHSVAYNTPINNIYRQEMNLDLEKNILMSQQEVNTYFNKFYVVPNILSEPRLYKLQDCITLQANQNPLWLRINVLDNGMLAMSIELPKKRESRGSFPQLRYFLSKRNDEQEMSRSHFREDIAGSKLEENMYISSNCDKWDYYRIDYVQGYINHSAFFTKVVPGEYILFIDPDFSGPLKIRFDSHVRMQEPIPYQPTPLEAKQIFDSTFFSISRENAVQATFNNQTFEQSIALNNSFEELGFGSICIKTLQKAKHKVAMRVYPEKLRAAGYQLLSHYDELQEDENKQKNFVLISAKGRPEIIVLERVGNRSKTEIGQIFPPPGTVEFFKVTPNNIIASSVR